jgi:hypothetical protein
MVVVHGSKAVLALMKEISEKRRLKPERKTIPARFAGTYDGDPSVEEEEVEDLATTYSRGATQARIGDADSESLPGRALDEVLGNEFGSTTGGRGFYSAPGKPGRRPAESRAVTPPKQKRSRMSHEKRFEALRKLSDQLRKPGQLLVLASLVKPSASVIKLTEDGAHHYIYNKLNSDEKARLIRGLKKSDTS